MLSVVVCEIAAPGRTEVTHPGFGDLQTWLHTFAVSKYIAVFWNEAHRLSIPYCSCSKESEVIWTSEPGSAAGAQTGLGAGLNHEVTPGI